jgi:hypothetical protein
MKGLAEAPALNIRKKLPSFNPVPYLGIIYSL